MICTSTYKNVQYMQTLYLIHYNSSSAYTNYHLKSVTRSNVAPADDIFPKHISRRMGVGRQQHFSPLTSYKTAESNTFWPHYYAQPLIGRKPIHIENVLVWTNCLKRGYMAIIKTTPFLPPPPSPVACLFLVYCCFSTLYQPLSQQTCCWYVGVLGGGCEFLWVKVCPVSLKWALLCVCCYERSR